jgi:hypothetical protein
MNPYAVWFPPFDRSSGGIVVLNRLAVELQKRGQVVFTNQPIQNPKWERIPLWGSNDENAIAVLPEILFNNPFHTKTVVHYLLNLPGVCGGPTSIPTDGICYTYSKLFNTKLGLPPERVMLIPHIDLDVFYDGKLPRHGRLVYRGKSRQEATSLNDPLVLYPLLGGKEDFRGDEGQCRLAYKLNRCEMLYCYDSVTAITEIARLCGCPVVLMPDNTWTWQEYREHEFWGSGGLGFCTIEAPLARSTMNSDLMRSDYIEAEKNFQLKLTEFIKITQEA